jgi:CubicO group peptidase (beta-lactamase class C family)
VEDEIGIEVVAVDIRPNGDISVEFGEGDSKEGEALAISICEPRIASVLEPGGVDVLGPPRNLGRPASDSELEALLSARANLGFEGAIIAEFNGERRIEEGFGTLAEGSLRKPDAATAFDCGSIMKEVTAAVIFLLEEDGVLSRSDSLSEHFADVPSRWADVTIDQVLTHRAGFDEYHDDDGDFEEMDRPTALERIFAQQPRFPPGSDEAYSNSGYTLLAALIEQASGEDYRALVRTRVFAKLAMTRSGFYGDPSWSDGNVAIGRGAEEHDGNDPSQWPAPTWALLGNGGLVSTVADLLSLAKAFDDERLFRAETREALLNMQVGARIDGQRLLGYAGGNDYGFNAVVTRVPEDSTYVVAASHVLAPVTAETLGIEVMQALYGAELELPDDED